MKNYTITVNDRAYTVAVEEGVVSGIAAAPAAPVAAPAAPATPTVAPVPTAIPAGATDSVSVPTPVPGKIVAVKAAAEQTVEKGDVILVLEAMKMENDIVTPQNGTVASINTSTGDPVESDTILVTLN